ncbi:unnamed protein product [Kluyveromyces dobzhanskii CBS 2104]|uniref:1,3-beta-glucan synthase n=1 Tax=Kluyveromyces dobzhanskii CBS 2104 TaxID=1427455 RepID=A0A0A8L4R5_9SACH|nr:unnamed protein product [Kluyveromyces dobzhanskii CBS 2104]
MDFVKEYAKYDGFWSNHKTLPSSEPHENQRKNAAKQKIAVDYSMGLPKIFDDLVEAFGFQRDNARNMHDYIMVLWESRNARLSPNAVDGTLSPQSLVSLYEEYIWGTHSNFTKWYRFVFGIESTPIWFNGAGLEPVVMNEVMTQLALWLLIWGESNNLRVMPELLCFIFDTMMREYKFYHKERKKVSVASTSSGTVSTPRFLQHVVNPLYEFYQFQITWNKSNDHSHIIGYDDINQCFWSLQTMSQFKLKDGSNYMDLPVDMKFLKFSEIEWSKSLRKTYIESRTWFHLITNFHRIWIIHIATFWYFSVINLKPLFTKHYIQTLDNDPELFILFSVMSLAGAISCLVTIAAIFGEMFFVPRNSNLRKPTKPRLLIVMLLFLINAVLPISVLSFADFFRKKRIDEKVLTAVAFASLVISILTTVLLSIIPLSKLDSILYYHVRPFSSNNKSTTNTSSFHITDCQSVSNSYYWNLRSNNNQCNRTNPFTENWSEFDSPESRFFLTGLWALIWTSKFVEAYFFLCKSIKNPARDLYLSNMNCSGIGSVLSSAICEHWTKVLLLLLILTNFVLYLLDTYLWYVIYNTIFSLSRSIYMGMTQLTPWKNCFISLTNKIKIKILPSNREWHISIVSELWNEIIYSMYNENLICKEHVERLIYHLTNDDNLLKPSLLSSTDDHFFRSRTFRKSKEIKRRLTYFAQSLHCPLPDPSSVEQMPVFSVLIPHYKEKILLSLKDIIRAETANSSITLLEYLKLVYPVEWNSYIEETSRLMSSSNKEMFDGLDELDIEHEENEKDLNHNENSERDVIVNLCKNSTETVNSFKFTGFKLQIPEQTIRTRVWASLRTQTLYRTVSGFMKYLDAIKTLHKLESSDGLNHSTKQNKTDVKGRVSIPPYSKKHSDRDSGIEEDKKFNLERTKETFNCSEDAHTLLAMKKFHMVCSMQRMSEFSDDEKENRDILLAAFPSLKIAYIAEEYDKISGKKIYYSCLIDGYCDIDSFGEYIPRYKIMLSGDPILGNGKSDNQNHSVIFTRGEFIQLIDANQDNYFEECLKIKNILKEFDDMPLNHEQKDMKSISPVAIVGTREHIFSENNGVLGDIAAGKEKVFGTFFARTLGYTNSKLHYGHPDFINAIFITTRGGVSKAQRGLHLNEDIYVGMNVLMRGGRIKHAEYYQCGKGRDLSFDSILNFTTKIGSGMGEQLLSREHFYFGTSLPLDRFLSFYYAHPGFHLNNVFIYISLRLLLIFILNLAVIIDSSILCVYDPRSEQTEPWEPDECLQLVPVLDWLRKSTVILIFVSMVSFVPLFLQQVNEKGICSAIKRLSKQMTSGAILFELFSSQIASDALISDIFTGHAKYLSTTRGLSFERIPFVTLFTKFSFETLYFAGFALLILTYASIVMWDISLIYFWVYFTALLLSPFIFNPSQFHWVEFITDYRRTLSWFFKWQRKTSWLKYTREQSTVQKLNEENRTDWYRVILKNFWCHIVPQGMLSVFTAVPFIIANINNVGGSAANVLSRLFVVTAIAVVINATISSATFIVSIIYGIVVAQGKQQWFPKLLTRISIIFGLLSTVTAFIMLSFFQRWHPKTTILAVLALLMTQKLLYQLVAGVVLPIRQNDKRNESWWTGKWIRRNHSVFSPLAEFVQKVLEMSIFNIDFILAHVIFLFHLPLLLIPNIDVLHSLMLFWRKADVDARPILFTNKGKQKTKHNICVLAFISVLLIVVAVPTLPFILNQYVVIKTDRLSETLRRLVQPEVSLALESEIGLTAFKNMMKEVFRKPR